MWWWQYIKKAVDIEQYSRDMVIRARWEMRSEASISLKTAKYHVGLACCDDVLMAYTSLELWSAVKLAFPATLAPVDHRSTLMCCLNDQSTNHTYI